MKLHREGKEGPLYRVSAKIWIFACETKRGAGRSPAKKNPPARRQACKTSGEVASFWGVANSKNKKQIYLLTNILHKIR